LPFFVANGVRLHTQILGAGPPVVLLHGLLVGSLATWYFTAAPALARAHRLLLYDLRGHGRSDRPPRGYDVATLAADLASLADGFDPGPLSLAGHSYGALVALRFALDRPGRVARLALVEAPLPPSRLGEMELWAGRGPAELLGSLPPGLREAVGSGGRRASRFLRGLRALLSETSALADLRAEQDVPDAALARLACPLLCVYGERSSCRPAGERLAGVVPGARLEVLPGGHYLPLEAPGPLTRTLAEFFHG
jgi:pimeloyl-ACP methyl ester carboxylesterase